MKVKVIDGMSNEEYHSKKDYISSSFVKQTHKHGVSKALTPMEPSAALDFGTAFHLIMESEQEFEDTYVFFEDSEIIAEIIKKRPDIVAATMTKDYKNKLKEFEESLEDGQQVLSKSDYLTIKSMHDSIKHNPAFMKLIKDIGEFEVKKELSYFTEEEDEFGLLYRVRPDMELHVDGSPLFAFDWKSCQDASVAEFKRDFYKYSYDIQDVFYSDIIGIPPENFIFVASEKKAPFASALYSLSKDSIESARFKRDEALKEISNWKTKGILKKVKNEGVITYL